MSSLVRGGDECRDSTSRNCLSDKGLGAGALSLSRLSFGREAGGFAGFRGDACLVLTDGSLQRGQDYGRVSAVGSGVASVGRLVWPRVWHSLGRPQRPSARDMTSRWERVVPTQCECTSRWDRKCELEKASHWHPSTRQRVGPRLCWRPKVAPPPDHWSLFPGARALHQRFGARNCSSVPQIVVCDFPAPHEGEEALAGSSCPASVSDCAQGTFR